MKTWGFRINVTVHISDIQDGADLDVPHNTNLGLGDIAGLQGRNMLCVASTRELQFGPVVSREVAKKCRETCEL